MTRAINVSDVIDTNPVGALQLRVFLLCAAVLFVDGFDVQGITYYWPRWASRYVDRRSAVLLYIGKPDDAPPMLRLSIRYVAEHSEAVFGGRIYRVKTSELVFGTASVQR